MSRYNGWTNYETWVWKLWIDNDQGTQEYWLETAQESTLANLAEQLESEANDQMENAAGTAGPITDILGAAMSQINWREIAESLIEEADEILDEAS